jgi:hypothetical protein
LKCLSAEELAILVYGLDDEVAALMERLDEAYDTIEQQRQEAFDNDYYIQRGMEYDNAPEGLTEAHAEIERLRRGLMDEQRAARDSRYTMPPKDLKQLLEVAYEAANHQPNWPDKTNRRHDKAREALVQALLELHLITGVDR